MPILFLSALPGSEVEKLHRLP